MAYATEEILRVLVLAGAAVLSLSIPISLAIVVLVAIVAAAALLIDYVLTVAVSVAAGIAAMTSALPWLLPYRVALGGAAVAGVAFSSGCTALTGIEAVSDGVPAFKPPEARNARAVLAWMALILGTLFLGITLR